MRKLRWARAWSSSGTKEKSWTHWSVKELARVEAAVMPSMMVLSMLLKFAMASRVKKACLVSEWERSKSSQLIGYGEGQLGCLKF